MEKSEKRRKFNIQHNNNKKQTNKQKTTTTTTTTTTTISKEKVSGPSNNERIEVVIGTRFK